MPNEVDSNRLACLDCGLPYEQFGMDMLLPRGQWLDINPDENGLLCAGCIVKRVASRIPRATAIHAVVDVAPPSPSPEGAVEVKVHVLIGANGCYVASHSENVAHAWAGRVTTPHKHYIFASHLMPPTAPEVVEAEVEESNE